MNVLVVGAGIAGPTLAFWLARAGHEVTLVERAPALRTGGYVVDFWGTGFEVASRMGVLPEIVQRGYRIQRVCFVHADGREAASFGADVFERATKGRYVSVPRSEISRVVYDALDPSVKRVFGETVVEIVQGGADVKVRFTSGERATFDLVVGADGLHSRVRELAFPDAKNVERYLGYRVAAFQVTGYPRRNDGEYVLFSDLGLQVGRVALRDDRTLLLLVFTEDDPGAADAEGVALVHRRFANAGWECPEVLAAMDRAADVYVDRVSQIRMDRWSRGRVVLCGDAAFCPSLLAGQGTALAMTAAYVLAGELAAHPSDPTEGLAAYEARLSAFIAKKQRAAEKFAGAFAPRTRLGLAMRNLVVRSMSTPWVADLAIGRDLRDELELPTYDFTSRA